MRYRKLLVTVLLLLLLPVTANASFNHVADAAGILTEQQRMDLEQRAAAISRKYEFGVYILTVPDYRATGHEEIYDSCVWLFEQNNLGLGEDRAGVTLMLSMSGRDYALDFNSDRGKYVFPEAARDDMEEGFLSHFRGNDFYGGFENYLDFCEKALAAAEAGEPLGAPKRGFRLWMVIPGLVAAALTAAFLMVPMRTASVSHDANAYVVPKSLDLSRYSDMFLNRTEHRQPRQTQSSSHHSSGSHSGRSGKF